MSQYFGRLINRSRIFSFEIKILRSLENKIKKKIIFIIGIQFLITLLDLVGISLLGVMGALAISGIEANVPSHKITDLIKFLNLNNFVFQQQILAIAGLAVILMVIKTFISILFTKKIYKFFASQSLNITTKLIDQSFSTGIRFIEGRSKQEILYALTYGVNALMIGVVANSVTIFGDILFLLTLFAGMTFADPVISLSSLFLFGLASFVLTKFLGKRAQSLGKSHAEIEIRSNIKILEALSSFRELFVKNQIYTYRNDIHILRSNLVRTQSEIAFLPNISKYVMESVLVLGILFVAGAQFLIFTAAHAFTSLAIFLAATTRIAPSMLRIQQSFLTVKNNSGTASNTLDLLKEFSANKEVFTLDKKNQDAVVPSEFIPRLNVDNVVVTHPGMKYPALNQVSLLVDPGEFIALVGPSGAGKSTLVDAILGIVNLDSGSVEISGEDPLSAIKKWPGRLSYVPQNPFFLDGTIRENVAQGFLSEPNLDSRVQNALNISGLFDYVKNLPNGLDSQVGDQGSKLSGGQRQRLALARGLFLSPNLLVLDEATSALDGGTESLIVEALKSLKGKCTLIVIAHRLSTIKDADKIYYLEGGKIRAQGTFDEISSTIPEFKSQAKLI
jgi:ABC-type multidrug transport system fused ATPase/permease subunit